MAKPIAPLLSFSASGQIAKTQVYASWKGQPYARRYVIPRNPRSSAQMDTRDTFAWLNAVWKQSPAVFQAPWTAFASGKVLTNRNAWLSKNTGVLRGMTDLTGITLSPGAGGGLAGGITAAPSAGTITITAVAPSPLPTGWSVVEAVGVAIRQQAPDATGTMYVIASGTDASSPYSIVLSSLAAAVWMWGGWFVFQKSSNPNDLAYGAAIGAAITVT